MGRVAVDCDLDALRCERVQLTAAGPTRGAQTALLARTANVYTTYSLIYQVGNSSPQETQTSPEGVYRKRCSHRTGTIQSIKELGHHTKSSG